MSNSMHGWVPGGYIYSSPARRATFARWIKPAPVL